MNPKMNQAGYRFLCLLLSLLLLLTTFPAIGESVDPAEGTEELWSKDFSIRMELNPEAFPASRVRRLRGYADLLAVVEIRGNLTCDPTNGRIDLNARVIPDGREDVAISFRLYGNADWLVLHSPLLGDEDIFLNMASTMPFASKAWSYLEMPVNYLSLAYPHNWEMAFAGFGNAWMKYVKKVTKTKAVAYSTLTKVAAAWENVVQHDSYLNSWIAAVTASNEGAGVLQDEFDHLPDYLLQTVALGQDLQVTRKKKNSTWQNADGTVICTETVTGSPTGWTLNLPETAGGYIPTASLERTDHEDGTHNLLVRADYTATDRAETADLGHFYLDARSIPASFPTTNEFEIHLTVSGVLFPRLNIRLNGQTTEAGDIHLTLRRLVRLAGDVDPVSLDTMYEETDPVLTVTGKLTPAEPAGPIPFDPETWFTWFDLLSINDESLAAFTQRISGPLLEGLMEFIAATPVTFGQSMMDDLTDYGLLSMVLN